MVIRTLQTVHVHRDTRLLRETLQAMRYHLTAQIPNLLPLQAEVDDRIRPIGKVDYRARQSLVERGEGGPKAIQAEAGCW